ncbi:hypothetical protein BDZ45DRAFT_716142 [Acephala macrosclerotiorum]|nr:hypothetical protein BDZ45DRAFT_716142 [Acephala macrosclerotiorum]
MTSSPDTSSWTLSEEVEPGRAFFSRRREKKFFFAPGYQSLEPPGNAIRLLTLLPGEFSDEIFLSISHVELDNKDHVKYEALSYTWGSSTHDLEKIHILQTKSQSGTDVTSLHYLNIRMNLLSALRYLRLPTAPRVLWIDAICIDQQNIVERSQEALVWLGPDDSNTPMALETIKTLSAGIVMEWHRRDFSTLPGSEAETLRISPEHSALALAHWRLWIRQEVRLASRVHVKCGHFHAEWEDIEKVAIFLEHSNPAKDHISISDILFCRSLFPYLGSDSLTYVLHRSSMCGFSDARDLVYANLSTSTTIKALKIKPDYTLSVAALYMDLACRYVQQFGTLEILRSCDLPNLPQDFMSFVPDFSVPKSESRLISGYAHGNSRHLPVNTKGNTLQLMGKFVAKIDGFSEFRKPLTRDLVGRDKYIEMVKIYQQWEPKNLMTAMYPAGGTLLDAYITLLAGGSFKETYLSNHHPTMDEAKEAFLAAMWSGGNCDAIRNPKFRPYLEETMSDRRGEVFFQTVEGYIGTSPGGVQIGDIITVLVGGVVPFVLRPVTDYQGCYQVVGPCYIPGVMFGEALFGPLPEPWRCIIDQRRHWCFQHGQDGKPTLEDPRLWLLPPPWQMHFCDYDEETGHCLGDCIEKHNKDGNPLERYFFNTHSKEKSRDDPRLDLAGLEKGGIILEKFILV